MDVASERRVEVLPSVHWQNSASESFIVRASGANEPVSWFLSPDHDRAWQIAVTLISTREMSPCMRKQMLNLLYVYVASDEILPRLHKYHDETMNIISSYGHFTRRPENRITQDAFSSSYSSFL